MNNIALTRDGLHKLVLKETNTGFFQILKFKPMKGDTKMK
jgi:hypothetical protein